MLLDVSPSTGARYLYLNLGPLRGRSGSGPASVQSQLGLSKSLDTPVVMALTLTR